MAIIARMTRSSLLDVMGRDYVRTARRQGPAPTDRPVPPRPPQRDAAGRDGHRPRSAPCCRGAVLTETIFGLTGIGRTIFEAITGRDYIVIQGFALVVAVIYLVVNLSSTSATAPRSAGAAVMSQELDATARQQLRTQPPSSATRRCRAGTARGQPPWRSELTLRRILRQRSAVIGLVHPRLPVLRRASSRRSSPPTIRTSRPRRSRGAKPRRPPVHPRPGLPGRAQPEHLFGPRRQRARRVQPRGLRPRVSLAVGFVTVGMVDRRGHAHRRHRRASPAAGRTTCSCASWTCSWRSRPCSWRSRS